MEATTDKVLVTLNPLVGGLIESDKSFFNAAEHVKNRGLKLLLKTYAQQYAAFAAELQAVVRQLGGTPLEVRDPGAAMGQGMGDIRAAMTIGRQSRQRKLLTDLLGHETVAVKRYADALKIGLPATVEDVVKRQHDRVRSIHQQLSSLAGQTRRRLVIRLFDQPEAARSAVDELQRAGFTADEVYSAAIEQVARVYSADAEERVQSRGQTIRATALSGLLFGVILGTLWGVVQHFLFPEFGGLISPPGSWGIVLEVAVAGGLIGAFFGFIFGLIIGQDKAEEDEYLYNQSLKDGDTLVVVFTDERNKQEAERLVGLKHQHEVKPMLA